MTFRKSLLILFCLMVSIFNSTANAQEKTVSNKLKPPIFGIIIPLPDESLLLKKNIAHHKRVYIDGIKYDVGTINNKNVVFVNSGLGKINAAIVASRLIRDFHPDLILMSGSSGNINSAVKKGDVVIGKSVINADFGRLTASGTQFQYHSPNPQTNTTMPLEFDLDNRLMKYISHLNSNHLPKIIFGKIATSDELPNQISQIQLLQKAKFDVVEMEGASLMQACWLFNLPCVVVRGVSNDAQQPFTQQDIKLAGDHAAEVVINIISNYKSMS